MESNIKDDSFQDYFGSDDKKSTNTVGKKARNEEIIVMEDTTPYYKKLSFQYGVIAASLVISAIFIVYFSMSSSLETDQTVNVVQVTASQYQQDFNQLQSAEEQIRTLEVQGIKLINENTEKNNEIAVLRSSLADANRQLSTEKQNSRLSESELQRLKTKQATEKVNEQKSIDALKSDVKKGNKNPLSGISINSVYSGHAWISSGNQTYAVRIGDKFKGITILDIDAHRNRILTSAGVIE
ncbi:TPA: hypothetical protein ACPY9J_002256 [Yersinia enterocolitica]